ncbi:MAG: M20/M25/M40 family metallo-hydrolase [Verrucomicrobiota bacterium]
MMEALDDLELGRRLTALTRDLILIRSTDARPEERARCFEFVRIQLEGLEGVELREYEQEGYGSMVVLPKGVEVPEVLFCGHLDVVEHPKTVVYTSEVRDGRIYGPGAGDMKGALAIMLELFRQEHERRPGASLGLAITSDEECGGENGVKYLVEEEGLRCGRAIIPDGGSLTDLTVEEKGILHLRLWTRGQAAHAARPWLGKNALSLIMQRIRRLEDYFSGLEKVRGEGDRWYATCAVTMARTANETVNRIPASAQAVLDVRFVPPETVETMMVKIQEILGEEVEVELIVSAEPTHLAADPVFKEVTEAVIGKEVREVRACGGSDGRFFRDVGIPVNLSRPLVGDLHSEKEWIDVESMVAYYRVCERYLEEKLKG